MNKVIFIIIIGVLNCYAGSPLRSSLDRSLSLDSLTITKPETPDKAHVVSLSLSPKSLARVNGSSRTLSSLSPSRIPPGSSSGFSLVSFPSFSSDSSLNAVPPTETEDLYSPKIPPKHSASRAVIIRSAFSENSPSLLSSHQTIKQGIKKHSAQSYTEYFKTVPDNIVQDTFETCILMKNGHLTDEETAVLIVRHAFLKLKPSSLQVALILSLQPHKSSPDFISEPLASSILHAEMDYRNTVPPRIEYTSFFSNVYARCSEQKKEPMMILLLSCFSTALDRRIVQKSQTDRVSSDFQTYLDVFFEMCEEKETGTPLASQRHFSQRCFPSSAFLPSPVSSPVKKQACTTSEALEISDSALKPLSQETIANLFESPVSPPLGSSQKTLARTHSWRRGSLDGGTARSLKF